MNENIKMLLEKLNEDEELADRLSKCQNPDEAYAAASEVVSGFTKEEFISTMEKIKGSIEDTGDLSDEDLSQVAGGDDGKVSAAVSVSCVATATCTIFIASAAI